jgi:hypothetical protein
VRTPPLPDAREFGRCQKLDRPIRDENTPRARRPVAINRLRNEPQSTPSSRGTKFDPAAADCAGQFMCSTGQFQRSAGRTTIQIRQVANAQGDGGFSKPRSRAGQESAEQQPRLGFLDTGLPAVGAGAESLENPRQFGRDPLLDD